ncbi:MAG TPA: FmdB family zinc ribbon protein [Dissulfurispiraceae bacterium]
MPIYEYECTTCRKRQEIMQRHDAAPLTTCPECGGQMKKLISNTSFVLRGTGWYKTDYASSKNGEGGKGAKPEKGAATEKKSAVAADSKSAGKTETKAEPAAKT